MHLCQWLDNWHNLLAGHIASVARMSAATSGTKVPAYRCAHAGYKLTRLSACHWHIPKGVTNRHQRLTVPLNPSLTIRADPPSAAWGP
jgi:hypothetical protein